MDDPVLVDTREGIATVTLHRPEKLNAYTTEMGDAVVAAFRELREEPSVRAVILTGAGRGFCAGVDLEQLRAHQDDEKSSRGPRLGAEDFLTKFPLELLEYPKPVIAAVNGPAIGVGVTMILPCDLRLAAAGAKLGLTFTKLGLLPGLGSTHLLPRLVGMGRALELVLTARVLPAEEAERIGLVNRVVAPETLHDEARALAAAMGEARPEVLAAAKRALHQGATSSMAEAMRNERALSGALRDARGPRPAQR